LKTLKEFYALTRTEDYFNFFEVPFDARLLDVKRFHIMKEYGVLIKRGFDVFKEDEGKLLDFLKFALIKVYMDYKNGHSPSAAEVWGMCEDGKFKGCLACAMQGGGCEC
jgi:nitrogenase-stabilizing/protective protein